MGKTILLKRGTAANLPDLQEGEPGWATDTKVFYVGDGVGAPVQINYASVADLLSAYGLDADIETLSLPADTTISSFGKTLVDDANASAALTTLGFSTYGKTLIDDANASAALTTLGVSTFAKTILDDTTSAAARATLEIPSYYVEGIRPEDYGAVADDSTDCTAAFALANAAASTGVIPYGPKKNIKLSTGTYRVTAAAGSYAVTVNCPIVGEGPDVSIIKNVGLGSALKIEGVNGEIYYSRFRDFSVVGNANSQDGIVLNPTAAVAKCVGYSKFDNVDSSFHGRHGLVHDGSWGTKYDTCKFHHNDGLGVYMPGTGTYSQHNNVIFQNCDSRWNGGTGNVNANYLHGGVRISGAASGVYWLGGVVESNNAWGFIIGEDSTYVAYKVVIRDAYGEGHPDDTVGSTAGGWVLVTAKYVDISVSSCTIYYGAGTGKTGYGFYVNDAAESAPGFTESGNYMVASGAGTNIRDYGI